MLKGLCEIVLTDTITGKTQITRDKNMVTNALNHLFNPPANMFTESNIYINHISANTPISTKALGGIMLFGDTIDENADNIIPPINNPVIGHAGNDSYSGTNTMRGSYNTTESSQIENGYRHVWDFGTSQAIGTIKCACLTSDEGGKIGWNNSDDIQGIFAKTQITLPFTWTPGFYIGNFTDNVGDIAVFCITKYEYSKYTLYVNGYRWSQTQFAVNDIANQQILLNSFQIDVSANYNVFRKVGNYIYGLSASALSLTNNSIKYVKINYLTQTIEKEDTITFPSTIGYFDIDGCSATIKDNYLYANSYDKNIIYKVNLDNISDIVEITAPIKFYMTGGLVNDCILISNSNQSYLYDGDTNFYNTGFNPHVSSYYNRYTNRVNFHKINDLYYIYGKVIDNNYGDGNYIYSMQINPYIATIDNLSVPITKTASQTMKVIYTITNA